MELDLTNKGITLLPFTNQVGGHTPFFRFSKKAICKPANKRKEQEFYVFLKKNHPELLPFISNYLGLLNVSYPAQQFSLPEVIFEDNRQLIQDWQELVTHELPEDILKRDLQQFSPNLDECKLWFETFRKRVVHEILEPCENITRFQTRTKPNNPWSQQVYERDRQKLQQVDKLKEFILLEDLTDGIDYPCVLDLKMGTRQYSVFSTIEKKQSQIKKATESTSLKLGVRICGMQVYNPKLNEYIFYDKYMGRKLNEIEFEENLNEFLNYEIDSIPILLHKLKRLYRILKTLKGYRFYGSSLLFIYDGKESKRKSIDVRMIDFEKSVSPNDNFNEFKFPPKNKDEPDHGYLLGLTTLINHFNKLL